jgi:hypothetical protein
MDHAFSRACVTREIYIPAPVCVNLEPIRTSCACSNQLEACMHVTVWLRADRNDRLELQQAAPCAVPLAQNAEAKATGLVE